MYRVIECLTQEHSWWLVGLAMLVCVLGSILSAQLMRRLALAENGQKRLQMLLSGMIAGTTIWATHFVAMLAYDPGHPHAYGLTLTVLSLGVAMAGAIVASALLGFAAAPFNYFAGGASLGLSISLMHFVGMAAYQVPGVLVWNPVFIAASTLLGVVFGVIACHRIIRPTTRLCWLGAAFALVSGIGSMHFTGMAAVSVEASPLAPLPQQVIADEILAAIIFAVTAILYFVGFAGMNIERGLEHEALRRIEQTARHDPLTGLPNRLNLARLVEEETRRLREDRARQVAALSIDLNLFKEVNDLHGHAAGDAVLCRVAERLKSLCDTDTFAARVGGDEFIVMRSGFRRISEARAFAERLQALLIEPVYFDGISLIVGAAVGVATTVRDGRDLDGLIRKSDLAMYSAKSHAAANVCLYDAEMDKQNRERILLINDLRKALENGEFELVYQLQNEVDSRNASGFEALLRWNHPVRGRISPAQFIPIAEQTGLIREIGLWVLRTACNEAASWPAPLRIAVNVAPQQLAQPSFTEHLSDILMESAIDPARLELEITEASIIDDQEHALSVMHRIKAMGVKIAMDDFGTGFSSLAMLRAFPFDKIKIDRSFVQDVHADEQRAAIVRSTLLLGEALRIPVLAEGVEFETELSFLREERCRFVQGFLFGKPMSLAEARAYAARSNLKIAPEREGRFPGSMGAVGLFRRAPGGGPC